MTDVCIHINKPILCQTANLSQNSLNTSSHIYHLQNVNLKSIKREVIFMTTEPNVNCISSAIYEVKTLNR